MLLLDREMQKINNIKSIYNKHTINELIDESIIHATGGCYGMTMLDLLYLSDRKYYLPQIDENADNLRNIKLTDSIRSMVNYYSLIQVLPEIQNTIADSMINETDTIRLKRLISLLEDGPVLVCYRATLDTKGTAYPDP